MGFTLTQLVRPPRDGRGAGERGEHMFRLARPIMIVAAGAMLIQTLNQELVIPAAGGAGAADAGDPRRDQARHLGVRGAAGRHDKLGESLLRAGVRQVAGARLTDLHIWRREPSGHGFEERISSPRAEWVGPEADKGRGGYWNLKMPTVQPLRLASPGAPVENRGTAGRLQRRGCPPDRRNLDPTNLLIKRYSSILSQSPVDGRRSTRCSRARTWTRRCGSNWTG